MRTTAQAARRDADPRNVGWESSGVGGDALEMRFGEVALDLRPLIRGLGQEVDMHLIGAEPSALMAEMGKVERDRVVLGLAEGERGPRAVVMAADEDVIGAWKGRAADQRVDTVQITPAGSAAPVMEGLVEAGFGADKRRLVGGAPRGGIGYICLVHQHGPVPALNPLPRTVLRWVYC